MHRILVLGLALLATACTTTSAPSVATICTGDPSQFGCVAQVTVSGVTYQDWGAVAISDAAKVTLVASSSLTTAVAWLSSPDINRIDSADHDDGVNYAGAGVWVVPQIGAGHAILLGPFPTVYESNLYELFLAPAGSHDVPLALCSDLKHSKVNPPLVCH